MLMSKFGKKLDTSDEYYSYFDARNESLKKQVGL